MSPNDRRHGTNAGYFAGCRQPCCLQGHADYYRTWRKTTRHYGIRYRKNAIGYIRRLQALIAIGHSQTDLAKRMGVTIAQVNNIIHGRSTKAEVNRSTIIRINRLYRQLSGTPGPSKHARTIAKKHGWAPPLAWTNIDDPAEKPNIGKTRTNYSNAELMTEWDHLRRSGDTLEQAATRLGITPKALERAIQRAA